VSGFDEREMYSTCLWPILVSWRKPMSELFHVNECSLIPFQLQNMRGLGSTIINPNVINIVQAQTHTYARAHTFPQLLRK